MPQKATAMSAQSQPQSPSPPGTPRSLLPCSSLPQLAFVIFFLLLLMRHAQPGWGCSKYIYIYKKKKQPVSHNMPKCPLAMLLRLTGAGFVLQKRRKKQKEARPKFMLQRGILAHCSSGAASFCLPLSFVAQSQARPADRPGMPCQKQEQDS